MKSSHCHGSWVALDLASLLLITTSVLAQDWPRYGHDGSLSGRSPGSGSITRPHIAWSFPLAGRELLVQLQPESGKHRVSLAADTVVQPSPDALTPAGPIWLDLDGSGTLRPLHETFHERWAKILPNTPGLQRVAWNYTWTDQEVCRLQLFAYDQDFDQPRRVWQSEPPEATIFNPLNVVFDIDGDDVLEICVAAHYRVMVFEGTTGRKECELRYHACRPYGWFGIVDLDADGQCEMVTIGDFQSHIDVLEFDPARPESERLSVKWRRDIEQDIERRVKWPQVGPHPVIDVTGDGRPEIVLNLFNDSGDDQWHVVVLDATNGRTVCDLPRRFLHGAYDIDADGKAEMFIGSTNGPLVKCCGLIELVNIQNLTPIVRWSRSESRWCVADLASLGPTWSTTASQGMRHIVLRGDPRPAFFVKTWPAPGAGPDLPRAGRTTGKPEAPAKGSGLHRQGIPDPFAGASGFSGREPTRSANALDNVDAITLTAMRCGDDGQLRTLWQLASLPDSSEVLFASENGARNSASALVRIRLPANTTANLSGQGVRPVVRQNQMLGVDVSLPIVAGIQPDAMLSIITEGAGQQVCAIQPPSESRPTPYLLWQRPGRGMRDGSRALGLLAADLDGDGACEVIAGSQAREGHALLVAYRGDGTIYWRRPFPQLNGALPVWNQGALTFWWPGRFRDPDGIDLLVNTRRSLMHSDVGQLIDGRRAATLWVRDKAELPGEFQWGFAGAPLATVDMSDDGRDDLVSLHPVCFWIADGSDGSMISGKELASRTMLPAWAAYGEPIVHDVDGDRRPETILDSPYILALLDRLGQPLWHGPGRIDYPVGPNEGNVGETTQCKHALTDFDGDGTMELASAGYRDGVRAIDPQTGQVLWSLQAPDPTVAKVAAVNIDGQGGDELIYVAGRSLVAVTGDRRSGSVLWTWEGPTALSMPAIADADADGSVEIIVQGANATVYCLDAAQ